MPQRKDKISPSTKGTNKFLIFLLYQSQNSLKQEPFSDKICEIVTYIKMRTIGLGKMEPRLTGLNGRPLSLSGTGDVLGIRLFG